MKKINLNKIKFVSVGFSILILLAVLIYYNVLFDITLIGILLLDSFLIGQMIKIKGNIFESIVMRTAVGLGIIGLCIYFVLLFGIGNKSVYISILLGAFCVSLPFAHRGKDNFRVILWDVRKYFHKYPLLFAAVIMVFVGYVIYASGPISTHDTLAKHLPITMYAAENGAWYTNVSESIVYGEPMVLQYTYSVLFVALGAYKALVLFNVVLFFFLYVILCYFVRKIYAKSNLWILGIILFTTPFFLQFSTVFYLEILPLYFLFSAFVSLGNTTEESAWRNVEIIAFLSGLSLFVKLTCIFTLSIMALVLIYYCFMYAWKNKKIVQGCIKGIFCLALAITPSVVSMINIWYHTGNPFFPSYNGIFKSPYFSKINFEDPFTNRLTLSANSLMDIVFHTTKNIEMEPLGLGVFLMFVFVIPIATIVLIIKKHNKNYLIWSSVAVVSYVINTLFTYNIRYYFTVWILFACVIVIGLSICVDQIPNKWIQRGSWCIVTGVLLLPNMNYIKKYGQVIIKLQKDESVVSNECCSILEQIPKDKTVLCITNSKPFKGIYEGYFASTTWHNSVVLFIETGEYSWEEYISSFDYILIDKTCDSIIADEDILNIANRVKGNKCAENNTFEAYEVMPQTNDILHEEYDELLECSVNTPIEKIIYNDYRSYFITHELVNETNESVTMRFQLSWVSEKKGFLGTTIINYEAQPGENIYISEEIEGNSEADYGVLYVCTADERTIKVKSYTLSGRTSVLEKEDEIYRKRERLKNTEKESIQ